MSIAVVPGRVALAATPRMAIGVALLLMAVAALENTVAPWAPFYAGYAALATALPFWLGVVRPRTGKILETSAEAPGELPAQARRPRSRVILRLAVHLVFRLVVALALAALLQLAFRRIAGLGDLETMFGALFEVASGRLGKSPDRIAQLYIAFIQIWAGLGEEVFYRGYLQQTLSRRSGAPTAIIVASALYAVRHYTQLLLLWRHFPWWSATVWVTCTFVVGLALGGLYHKTRALYPSIVCHYAFNLLA